MSHNKKCIITQFSKQNSNLYHYKLKMISKSKKTIIKNFKNTKQFEPSKYQNDQIWTEKNR